MLDTECRAGHGSISQDCRPGYEISRSEGENPLRAAGSDLHDQIELSVEHDIDVGIALPFAEQELARVDFEKLRCFDDFVDLVFG